MKPQPLMLETKTESESHVTSSADAGNTGENNISQCGILSWGAPAIHSFKYKNGGLAEMARKMYRSEEKRLDRIETNRLLQDEQALLHGEEPFEEERILSPSRSSKRPLSKKSKV